ncbi:MAG: hypothetical protein ABI655_10465 [Phenylobacterium sp.]
MPEARLDASSTPQPPIVEVPLAALNAGMSLMALRSRAISDYWKSLAAAREPADFLTLQLGYLTKLAEDYAAAFAEVVAPAAEALAPVASAAELAAQPAPILKTQAKAARPSAPAEERHFRSHDGEELNVRPQG